MATLSFSAVVSDGRFRRRSGKRDAVSGLAVFGIGKRALSEIAAGRRQAEQALIGRVAPAKGIGGVAGRELRRDVVVASRDR